MRQEKNKKSVRDELEAVSPQLARLKEQMPPLDIPDGYFNQLSDAVMQQIKEEELRDQKPPVPSWWGQWWSELSGILYRPAYAMALAGVVILMISVVLLRQSRVTDTGHELVLTEEDINDYINYHIDDFDLNLLAEEVTEQSELAPLVIEEEYLEEKEVNELFDELLDEIALEDLL